jgi:hypothetical protein
MLRQRGNRVVTNEQFAHWSYAFACFVVRDNIGQQLAYIYFEDEPGRRSVAKLLSKDEARRIAANIAKLQGAVAPPQALRPAASRRPGR